MRTDCNTDSNRRPQEDRGARIQWAAHSCQSCGMELHDRRFWGTDKGNAPVSTFCIICFKDGKFTEPNLTMEEMGWRIHRLLVQKGGLAAREASSMIDGILPKLKRWKENGG